jgi:DnaJ family protein B protein 4
VLTSVSWSFLLSINQVIRPGQETRIPGEGFPITKASSIKKVGDMVVRWNVVFPERITPSQAEGLKKILG